MSGAPPHGTDGAQTAPSALFVTTVPITLEAFLLPLADHSRADGWRVDAAANGATSDAHLEDRFDHLFDVPWSRDPLTPSNVFGAARRIRDIVAAGRYDLVHVHTPVASFLTRFALRRMRGRAGGPVVIYTAHGFHFYRGQAAWPHALFRTMERVAAPWTDYLVTINAEDYDAARELGGIPADRVRRVPGIGVDTDLFAPGAFPPEERARVRASLGVPDDAFVLSMVAELAPVKRHGLALRAFALVRDPSAVLVLVGSGPLEADLRRLAAGLGISDRVRWAGYRRDVPAVLAASDALLLTSEREGLNRSVLEAMASGVPVIGTDTRGITDAVGPEAGWIVGHDDTAALASAIDAAASDRTEAARRGAAGRERAVSEFSLPRVIDAYEELYREALASRV